MISVWLDKLFKLPPDEQWKSPFPEKLMAARVRDLSAAFYIQLLSARSVFLVTFVVGILYFVSSIFNVSINLGAFVITMPSHNFIDVFVKDFGKRVPYFVIATSLYYSCLYLRNVTDLNYLFAVSREKGRTDGDVVFTHVWLLPAMLAIIFGSFGLPLLLLKGTSPDSALNNSYLVMFIILAWDSIAFGVGVIFLIQSTLGLFYYFPKYYREKKRHDRM